MTNVNLYDENLRKKYSDMFFSVLTKIVSYNTFHQILEKESNPSRNNLHTFEYWWIKYKMAKGRRKIRGDYFSDLSFEQQKIKNQLIVNATERLLNYFISSNQVNLDEKAKDRMRHHIFTIITNECSFYSNTLYAGSDKFNDKLFFESHNDRFLSFFNTIIQENDSPKTNGSNNIECHNETVKCLSDYLRHYELKNIPQSEASKAFLNYIVAKLDLKKRKTEYYRELFDKYYISKKVPLKFDEVFEKYGAALFDFLEDEVPGIPYELHPTDIDYLDDNCRLAIAYLLDYYAAMIFNVIYEYENIIRRTIIDNKDAYWKYIKQCIYEYIFEGNSSSLDDDWYLKCDAGLLNSGIATVPSLKINNIVELIKQTI